MNRMKKFQQRQSGKNASILKHFFFRRNFLNKRKKLLNSLVKGTLREFICRSFPTKWIK